MHLSGDLMMGRIVWADLHLQYDKMKDESEEVHETLRKFCEPRSFGCWSELIVRTGVSWTQTFDISDKPHFVLSSTYKSSPECNYAVCFGVRILLPAYLNALLSRFRACWKKVADSQDSFSLPDEMDRIFQPQLDTALPKSRGDVQCWLPDDRRLEMFQGWKLMGLRGQAVSQSEVASRTGLMGVRLRRRDGT
jgi:hypothetical protein